MCLTDATVIIYLVTCDDLGFYNAPFVQNKEYVHKKCSTASAGTPPPPLRS